MIGKTLAHYEITATIGRGGMGEVFKAKDHKLGRDVAIKVLPEEFARDADRVARFQREAKLLASLNHPNIAAIYGLEESGGTNFLVLELVEGETLADRIKAGPVPVEESLQLALQIAEALEAAHEKGVIHRDLKPANIKVTPDGKVKMLDFGLAKAYAGDQEANLSNSPTLSDAATKQGVILGTAAYMSPEQARGKPVDKRTDIWAFGCVLYEMLTGQVAFQGEDVTEILAAVVRGGADLDLLPANIHPRVREVIIRCLQKDQKRRYPEIGEAHYEIEKVLSEPGGIFVQPISMAEPRRKRWTKLPWIAAAVALGSIITGVAVWKLKPPEQRRVVRFDYELPEGQQFSVQDASLTVSPDGSKFVYCTTAGLFLRSLDKPTAQLIAGSEKNAKQLFFSPDSQWVAYWSQVERKIRKIAIGGGAPVTLTEVASNPNYPSWSADNGIVYFQNGKGILRVTADGGVPETLVKESGQWLYGPQILPGGKSVLFISSFSKVVVQSIKSGQRKELFRAENARYVPTGHIVYGLGHNIYAVPLDLDRLEVSGGPIPLIEAVGEWQVSDSGTLVYLSTGSEAASVQRTLVWVDRNGKEEPLSVVPDFYEGLSISPDGVNLALTIESDNSSDIWIWDLVRSARTRLTRDTGGNHAPLWTRDGKRIVFSSNLEGNLAGGISWKAADGVGREEPLKSLPNRFLHPSSWSADGKSLITREFLVPAENADIGAISMEGDHKWEPLLKDKYNELHPKMSPNGQWMAYTSDESGQNEVYVRTFPEVDKMRRQVSTGGGDSPLWSRDGKELFYRNGDAVMAVSVKSDPDFSLDVPKVLFHGSYVFLSDDGDEWDIHPDGKRFLMIKPAVSTGAAPAAAGPQKINIVLNWTEELKQRVPVK